MDLLEQKFMEEKFSHQPMFNKAKELNIFNVLL